MTTFFSKEKEIVTWMDLLLFYFFYLIWPLGGAIYSFYGPSMSSWVCFYVDMILTEVI